MDVGQPMSALSQRGRHGLRDYSIGCKMGVPGAAWAVAGAACGSGTINLQSSPVEAKVASIFPPNCSSARRNNRVPKPRWIGAVTGGPSLSRHSRFRPSSELSHWTDILPTDCDKAPYFAALV